MILLVGLLWKFSTNELNLSVYDFKNFQDELEGEVDLDDNGTELPHVGNLQQSSLIEPRHDKTNKVTVRQAKTQISLGIRPVWSESSLCA